MGRHRARRVDVRAWQIVPQCSLTKHPEQMSPYKRGLYFCTNVHGHSKYMMGRQSCDIKAKSVQWKSLPAVWGALENHVIHLSGMVEEADGTLLRSIKHVR